MAIKGANGVGKRKLDSWVEGFTEHTSNLESPKIYRRWAAIGAIAAALEQKVWLQTSSPLYPNLYVFIVGHPGVGKTRTIRAVKGFLAELSDFHMAPTSLTAASLVDALVDAKRFIARLPDDPLDYNTMYIAADELGAFMHEYDNQMIGVLSSFYDVDPYGQNRRGKELKIKIKKPQLNLLCGTTPANLVKFIPEGAWDQGFTSRIILVFSDERIVTDIFADVERNPSDLAHDLKMINSLIGRFEVTADYRNTINAWRSGGQKPTPAHPKLIHYTTRRLAHIFKLSMVAAVDKSNQLLLTKSDFETALSWLVEAEDRMAEIFQAGAPGADSKAMDEIFHFIHTLGGDKGIPESKIVNFARERIPAHSVMRVIGLMELSGMIKAVSVDKIGIRFYKALSK